MNDKVINCAFCGSNHVVGGGWANNGVKIWRCQTCKRRFREIRNYGSGRNLTQEHIQKLIRVKIPLDGLKSRYVDCGLSLVAVAKYYHCDVHTIKCRLKENGIKVRTLQEQSNTDYCREIRRRQLIGNKNTLGYKTSPETKLRMSRIHRERFTHPEVHLKLSSIHKKLWANQEHKTRQLKLMAKNMHVKPNKAENLLMGILDSYYPNEWKYVGNWSLIIANKNPDFINVDGKRMIIELFGDYWHRGENPQARIDIFANVGYKTLVVWERELKDVDKLIATIRQFVMNRVEC